VTGAVQFHGGDPGAGDMWERRVDAQAINERTEMAREIAHTSGSTPRRSKATRTSSMC